MATKKKVETAPPPPAEKPKTPRCCMLTYDIPSSLDYPNPSGRLRRVAVRVNLSCWIVPTSRVPQDLLDEFEDQRINYHLVSFDAKEKDTIHAIAQKAIEEETARLHGSLIKRIDDADIAYKEAQRAMEETTALDTENGRYKAIKDKLTRTKAALLSAGDGLNAAIEAAELFDETMNVEHLLEGLKLSIASATASFNAELEANRHLMPEPSNCAGIRKTASILSEATGVRVKILGYTPTQILRRLGKDGWSVEDAKQLMLVNKVDCTESTIRTCLSGGRSPRHEHHLIDPLSEEQVKSLRKMIS